MMRQRCAACTDAAAAIRVLACRQRHRAPAGPAGHQNHRTDRMHAAPAVAIRARGRRCQHRAILLPTDAALQMCSLRRCFRPRRRTAAASGAAPCVAAAVCRACTSWQVPRGRVCQACGLSQWAAVLPRSSRCVHARRLCDGHCEPGHAVAIQRQPRWDLSCV